jgi:hypothetical protein
LVYELTGNNSLRLAHQTIDTNGIDSSFVQPFSFV